MTTTAQLAKILVDKFGSWVGTPSESLLGDSGMVNDHLSDDYDREVLAAIPQKTWDAAWLIFDLETRQDQA